MFVYVRMVDVPLHMTVTLVSDLGFRIHYMRVPPCIMCPHIRVPPCTICPHIRVPPCTMCPHIRVPPSMIQGKGNDRTEYRKTSFETFRAK